MGEGGSLPDWVWLEGPLTNCKRKYNEPLLLGSYARDDPFKDLSAQAHLSPHCALPPPPPHPPLPAHLLSILRWISLNRNSSSINHISIHLNLISLNALLLINYNGRVLRSRRLYPSLLSRCSRSLPTRKHLLGRYASSRRCLLLSRSLLSSRLRRQALLLSLRGLPPHRCLHSSSRLLLWSFLSPRALARRLGPPGDRSATAVG